MVFSWINTGSLSFVESEQRQTTSAATIEPAQGDIRTRIIAFVDERYKEYGIQWYRRLEKLGYSEHLLVATDAEAVAFLLKQPNVRYDVMMYPPCIPYQLDPRKYRRQMFARRWKYVQKALQGADGQPPRHILLSDADISFNKHYPMSDLERSEHDVHYAYSHGYPEEVSKKMGFTVCGGMVWLRSTPGVNKFVGSLLNRCNCLQDELVECTNKKSKSCTCDDQVVLNELLSLGKHKIRWNANNTRWGPRTGISEKTGHKVKVWSRDFAFRGPMPETCPSANNWVAMPLGVDRGSVIDAWDKLCDSQAIN